MKDYIDAMIFLIKFLTAFESALDQRKKNEQFAKFHENNKATLLLIVNSYEKQALELLI